MIKKPYNLILDGGLVFPGYTESSPTINTGEVVFTTGMTGYVETLTDPSYQGQIIVFTYPLIGNYGVPPKQYWESTKIHASGVVLSELCLAPSHHQAVQTLQEWLHKQNVPVIIGIDTRRLTKLLRTTGTRRGVLTPNSRYDFSTYTEISPVPAVSIARKKTYGHGKKKIIAVDCGMKENIIRSLQKFPYTIERVPYNYDYTTEHFDGILISNGPGDPAVCTETIAILKKALILKKPIFGICLGSQLMALASGAKTYKLPFGHRGHNQPCLEEKTGHAIITSQNHGYAIDEKTLTRDWYVNFRNLNDGSVEGIAHRTLPFFSVQFHPEAAPGPTDSAWLFDVFYEKVVKSKNSSRNI